MSNVGYIARLAIGERTLDISSGRYTVAQFVPPTTSEAINVASGLSSNRTLGGIIASRRGTNFDFSFSIRVMGASQAEVERGVNDLAAFLRQAGNEDEPLYLEWLPNGYVPYKPIWGQDGWRRLEIVYGSVYKSAMYFVGEVRTRAQIIDVSVNCKPYAVGLKQHLAEASGGICEDFIGAADGFSRGLVIPEATTNKMTNPIFGYFGFYNYTWVAAANVAATENKDKQFILFGDASARLKSSSTSTNNQFYQAINVGNTNTHTFSAWVKKLDGSAVTSSDVVIYYGGEKTSTYTSLGNGWYRVSATAAGINAATNTGIAIKGLGTVLYLAGYQAEEKSYATPLAHGDMMGCAWTGTAHASTSTRTASSLYLDAIEGEISQSSFRVVIRTDCDNTCGTFTFFKGTANDAYYNSSDDKIYFGGASSSALTWSAGSVIVLHFTRGANGGRIYVNGASNGTSATALPATNESLQIGYDTNEYLRGWWLDFTIWDRELTATEIANDYANIIQVVSDNQALHPIPWIWGSITTVGDMVVAGGIPGDIDADTYIDIRASNTLSKVYINQLPGRIYSGVNSAGRNYVFRQLSASDAVAVGSASVEYNNLLVPLVLSRNFENYAGEKCYILTDWSDTGEGTVYTAAMYRRYPGVGGSTIIHTYVVGDYVPLSSGVQLVGPIRLPDYDPVSKTFPDKFEPGVEMALACLRVDSASVDNVVIDWYCAYIGRTAQVVISSTSYNFKMHGREVFGYTTLNTIYETEYTRGDLIELVPRAINHLMVIHTDTVVPTIQSIIIIPRYLVT